MNKYIYIILFILLFNSSKGNSFLPEDTGYVLFHDTITNLDSVKVNIEIHDTNSTVYYTESDFKNTVRYKSIYKNGKRNGPAFYYDEFGHVRKTQFFINDEITYVIIYNPHGKGIFKEYGVNKGIYDGYYIRYWSNGKIMEITQFRYGKVAGLTHFYSRKGRFLFDVESSTEETEYPKNSLNIE